MNGAHALIESLLREQVDHIFGYAGATICPVVDALKEHPEIGYTLVRTEQNAGHMASGYARVSGKVGVCMVTSGPGATNLITGIATAYMDSIPMVAITGQVPSHLLGRDIFQEVDITGAVAPFSKHSYLVKNANDIPRVVREAFHIASTGRPGPVLIDIPIDVQEQTLKKFDWPEEVNIRGYKPSVKGNDLQIKRVVETIAKARQPLICAGGGVWLADAQEELLELAETANIPVVKTMMGIGLMPTDHPLNLGMIGAHGNHCANKALAKSDLLIMVGTRAADRAIISPDEIQRRMATIHIDVDPAEIGKNMQAAVPLVGNVKVILRQILDMGVSSTDSADWLAMLRDYRKAELSRVFPKRPGSVFPGTAIRRLGAKLDEDAVVCVDVGQNQIFTCKYFPQKHGRLLTSGGLGTMGYALPAAIGVKVAKPGRQTVVVCGDGSFQMAMNELAAIRCADLDIKILVFQNHTLGLVHQIQKSVPYHGPFGVDLDGSPDFAAIAAAYGIPSIMVREEEELDEAIERFLSTKGACLMLCEVHPDVGTND
ncbi:biosynthetic-type acetolactate synthase large subunit [Lawsonibacter sp. OA9]|uniref:Acetolactate synthase n=1 Tax=Flintibacter hominis TaxID=2763048 RepID=A0A8J6J1Z0_9FIRM|nr:MULTISPECIES: biosynthetic-type acetolactate synthase large subunit [Eubacteriales]SCH51412.1 Acetolactate synthase large subunit [uncultured Clostridium sp.]SCI97378.1 Acetolactate synthase large subunit [uncultured Flavonifractor sp.]MBC5722864.1 biosynthetic-type acetolactate synthase large subunit [Flintibacter hominis]MCH1978511.1 biosynthetic-type acetolactate synthase large subunit [Lawsonibacter sp. OA9]MCU6702232.1 biosynthetic-type acetolactate synthase large subunit [Muriventrico